MCGEGGLGRRVGKCDITQKFVGNKNLCKIRPHQARKREKGHSEYDKFIGHKYRFFKGLSYLIFSYQ